MKKYTILLVILALVLASLACQTLSGGSNNVPEAAPPSNESGAESQPEENNNSGSESSGAKTEFPLPDGAMNVQDLGGTTNFQVKMTLDEAMKFYKDALTKEGYTERTINTVTSETTFSMVFDGHKSGKAIVVQGVDMGDGTVNVNIRLEDV